MKKILSASLLTIVVALGVVFGLATQVNAEDTITPNTIANNTIQNTNIINSSVNNTNTNTTNTNITPTNIISSSNTTNNTITNTSTYNNTTLPKTGAEDYTIVFAIIGICAVAAVYAYKKMSDYRKI